MCWSFFGRKGDLSVWLMFEFGVIHVKSLERFVANNIFIILLSLGVTVGLVSPFVIIK